MFFKKNREYNCSECSRHVSLAPEAPDFNGLCYYCLSKMERERIKYLSTSETNVIVNQIILNIKDVPDFSEEYELFNELIAFQDFNTENIAKAALASDVFYPPELFKDASEEVVKELIELLLNRKCEDSSEILECLALQRGLTVQKVLRQLDSIDLDWKNEIYYLPSEYSKFGGWCMNDDNQKVDLVFSKCYPLHNEMSIDNSVIVGERKTEHCNTCGCSLIDLMTIDGKDERLSFIGLEGKITIPICPNCIGFVGEITIRYEVDGPSSLSIPNYGGTENYVKETDFLKMESFNLNLSEREESLFYSYGLDDFCVIGGYPKWMQGMNYAHCPDCTNLMKFLAAFSMGMMFESDTGTVYLEICLDCSIVVAIHQL